MTDHKLILIDGMPGTGKSSLSHLLSIRLNEIGGSIRWVHEEDYHPVRQFYSPQSHDSAEGYLRVAIEAWRSYCLGLSRTNTIEILDAAFLQNHLRSLLIFDVKRETIVDLFSAVEETIAPLKPAFLYLKPASVTDNFRRVAENRGERMMTLWLEAHERYPYTLASPHSGRAAFTAFWEEYTTLADSIYDSLEMIKLRQSTADDNWASRLSQACEWLGIHNKASPACCGYDVERFFGAYAPSSRKDSPGFTLQNRKGNLVAQVDEPTFDPDLSPIVRFGETELIPKSPTVWRLLGWPYDVRFRCEEHNGETKWFAAIARTESDDEEEIYLKQ